MPKSFCGVGLLWDSIDRIRQLLLFAFFRFRRPPSARAKKAAWTIGRCLFYTTVPRQDFSLYLSQYKRDCDSRGLDSPQDVGERHDEVSPHASKIMAM